MASSATKFSFKLQFSAFSAHSVTMVELKRFLFVSVCVWMCPALSKHKSDRRTLKPNISLLLLIFFCRPASEWNENKYRRHSFLRSLCPTPFIFFFCVGSSFLRIVLGPWLLCEWQNVFSWYNGYIPRTANSIRAPVSASRSLFL